MKINGPGYIKPNSDVKKKEKTSAASGFGSVFKSLLTDETQEKQPINATASLDNLLTLQQVSEDEVKRQKTILSSKQLLDEMEGLKNSILMGYISHNQLNRIQGRLRMIENDSADPRLREIVNEIQIRAAVELAKLGKYE